MSASVQWHPKLSSSHPALLAKLQTGFGAIAAAEGYDYVWISAENAEHHFLQGKVRGEMRIAKPPQVNLHRVCEFFNECQ